MRSSFPLGLAVFLAIAVAGVLHAQTYTFEHLAGSTGGSGSDDGPAADARFSHPTRVAADGAGNVYVADSSNATIRKITASGLVVTVAGLAGSPGTADGAGSSARFNYPSGIVVARDGNLFVADELNHTVRRVTPSGVVTTFAGLAGVPGSSDGSGMQARFDLPTGLTIDSAGNVYVADSRNDTIRRVTPEGVVTTLAGTPGSAGSTDGTGAAARFNQPAGVAVDAAGNVFVADTYNCTIRKITPPGAVTTVAGNPAAGGWADGNGTAARFSHPTDIAFDAAGNAYITDWNGGWLRKMTASGDVTTVPAASRFVDPEGVTVDSGGSVYVADSGSSTSLVWKITPAGVVTNFAGVPNTGSADGAGSDARFNAPRSIAVDAAGNAYVADSLNHTVRKITPGGVVSTFAGAAGQQGSADGGAGVGRLLQPTGIAVDSSGIVYVSQPDCTIRKITPDGYITTFAGTHGFPGAADGTGTAARFSSPLGLAVDAAGNVYVADKNWIRKINPAAVVTTIASGAGEATSLGIDSAGNIWFYDRSSHYIKKISATGSMSSVKYLAPWTAAGSDTNSITVTAAGTPYYTLGAGDQVARLSATVEVIVGGDFDRESCNDFTGESAGLQNPQGIFVDGSGAIYVTEWGGNDIRVGRPTSLLDQATIDAASALTGEQRQLGISPLTTTSFSWRITRIPVGSNGAALSSTTIANPTFTPDAAGRWEFRLRAQGAGGVKFTTVAFEAIPRPEAVVSGGGTVCNGTPVTVTATLTGTAPWNLTWSDGVVQNGVMASVVNRSVTAQGTYSVTAIADANASSGTPSGSAIVTSASAPSSVTASVTGRATFCTGESGGTASAVVSGGAGFTYQWGTRTAPGGTITPVSGATASTLTLSQSALGLGAKLLVVTVSSCGVSVTSNEIAVGVYAPPATNLTAGTAVFANTTNNTASVDDAGPGATYDWSISNGTVVSGAGTRQIVFSTGDTGPLTVGVTVTNAGSCTSAATQQVAVRAAPAAENFYLIAPCRLFDSRNPAGAFGGPSLMSGYSRRIVAVNQCGIPPGADAIVATITAVNPPSGGWFTLFPADTVMPFVSTVNYRTGKTRANNAVVPLSGGGAFSAYSFNSSAAAVDVIVDVTGYFLK